MSTYMTHPEFQRNAGEILYSNLAKDMLLNKPFVVWHEEILQVYNFPPRLTEPQHGWSRYRGVIILWDLVYDTTILKFVDQLTDEERNRLIGAAIYDQELSPMSLSLLFMGEVPDTLRDGKTVKIGSDVWRVFRTGAQDNLYYR